MDGIGTENSDIIMLASTNRADMLDKGNLLKGNDNYMQGYRNCYGGKIILDAPDSTLFLEGLRGFGGVDDLKKAEMDKTLRNGLIMSEMDPLNQKWLDFAI